MGGGGGGASAYPSTPGMTGKSGGSGVVMFRYLYPRKLPGNYYVTNKSKRIIW